VTRHRRQKVVEMAQITTPKIPAPTPKLDKAGLARLGLWLKTVEGPIDGLARVATNLGNAKVGVQDPAPYLAQAVAWESTITFSDPLPCARPAYFHLCAVFKNWHEQWELVTAKDFPQAYEKFKAVSEGLVLLRPEMQKLKDLVKRSVANDEQS